ncbi:MAG: HYR domain-containing protein, partial [Saprospiraceae bacterium]|nr:HYR domain-containing protein [Saprospiraceae bacterium]
FVVTDASNNTAICSFDVTVTDNENPVINCVVNQAKNTDIGTCGYTVTGSEFDPTSFGDNCPGSYITNNFNNTNTLAGASFHKGTTTVVWTVTDAYSNTTTCSFDVVVTDNENPVIACVANQAKNTAVGECSYTVIGSEFDPTSFGDNCPNSTITNDFNNSSTLAGAIFPKGSTNVVWTVSDASSNIATCSFEVVVTDNENPSITLPTNISINNDPGICGAKVNYTVGYSDNCFGSTIAQTAGLASGSLFPIGTTTNTFVVTDASGNYITGSFDVIVTDNEAPVVITKNITVYLDANGDASIVPADVDGGTSDNCSFNLTVFPHTFDCAIVGPIPVTLTATDSNNNSSTGIATVTVLDTIPPVFLNCPNDTIVYANKLYCEAKFINWVTPSAYDNCSYTITNNVHLCRCFLIGTTSVTYTVTDPSGNFDTCTFNVTVIPLPLVVTNQTSNYNGYGVSCAGGNNGFIDLTVDGGCVPYTYNWSNGATTQDINGLSAGIYTVTIKDFNNTVFTTSFTITEPPLLTANAGVDQTICLPSTAQLNGVANGGIPAYIYFWKPSGTLNNSQIANPIASPNTNMTYSLFVIDANGCFATDQVTVSIGTPPTASITVTGEDDFCDGCDGVVLTAHSSTTNNLYLWSTNETTQSISLKMTTHNPGLYSVTVTDLNGCPSDQPATYNFQPREHTGSYSIIGLEEVELGEKNYVLNGSVGVADNNGTATFDKYTEIQGNGAFAIAKFIQADAQSFIPLKYYEPAPVTLPVMQLNTQSGTYTNVSVNNYTNTTITSNFVSVEVGKNATVTLTGNVFGNIELNKGSKVIFTSSDIDIVSINVKESKSYSPSTISFTQNATVRILQDFKIDDYSSINPENYDVCFYIGCDIDTSTTNCGPCDGKVTHLTLRYNGSSPALIKVKQKDGTTVFNNNVNPGENFSFVGTDKKGTLGTEITVYVNNTENVKIHTSCSQPIEVGLVFGDFTVMGGASRNGGALCVAEEVIDDDCGPCDGKVTYLTLKYNGSIPHLFTVKQKNGATVFNNTVNPGESFSFIGTDKGTLGTEITISYNNKCTNVTIHTSCSQPIEVGMTFGEFTVMAGASKNGGALCVAEGVNMGCDDDDDNVSACGPGILDIDGKAIEFNGSVYIPDGEIYVHGSSYQSTAIHMKGLFIAKSITSTSEYVYWDWNDCVIGSKGSYEIPGNTASVEEIVRPSFMNAYPNPATSSENITVEFNQTQDKIAFVELYSLIGGRLKQIKIENSDLHTNKVVIDMSNIPVGIYMIRVVSGDEMHTQKVVLTK